MSSADASLGVLTEDQLKQISRNVRKVVPRSENGRPTEEELNQLVAIIHNVFQAAESSSINASHRVAAWNAVCALIDECSTSKVEAVSDIIWNLDFWKRGFELYLNHSHNARPKSTRQLRVTLTSAATKTTAFSDSPQAISCALLDGIVIDQPRSKACMQLLSHFLSKEVLSLKDILASLALVRDKHSQVTVNQVDPATVQDLLSALLVWLSRSDFGSSVGHLISAVLDKAETDLEVRDQSQQAFWVQPLDNAIKSKKIDIAELRMHVLPILFRKSLSQYVSLLYRCGLGHLTNEKEQVSTPETIRSANHDLLFASLRCGKEMGILNETDGARITQASSDILLPVQYIQRLLLQASREARLTGLFLLVHNHSATRPYPSKSLRLLKRHLYHFLANTDANFRSEVFSLIQRLIDRIRAITAVLARQDGLSTSIRTTINFATLLEHKLFLEWLLPFLYWELRPTASYQTHISALKALSVVARSSLDDAVPAEQLSKSAHGEAKWPFHLQVVTNGCRRHLLDLLMDPFDDVRQMAASILSLYVTSSADVVIFESELSTLIARAEAIMLQTCRADHADGVAHMYALVHQLSARPQDDWVHVGISRHGVLAHLTDQLERMLHLARENLLAAVSKHPIHGLFISLRYILAQSNDALDLEDLLSRLIRCLHTTWDLVQPVLCNDAPEGYVLEEEEELADGSTKATLSYCWRALKESSSLLGCIISLDCLHSSDRISLSNLCFTLLAKLRHRGAFSTVAQTWALCCTRCVSEKSADGQTALHSWYREVVLILENKTTINTRRSAGLPSLLCGLLIADKSGELFQSAFEDLERIARQLVDSTFASESSLPQVHALNCIKDILKITRLGEQSERYVPQALRLAADSLRSEAWAIRNCGLMLFRAVIDRLLGTSEAHLDDDDISVKWISIQRNPELLDIVLELLNDAEAGPDNAYTSHIESVFPALQLLGRLQIPSDHRDEVRHAILPLMSSSHWHIRDKAARAYVAIIPSESLADEVLITVIDHQNNFHGTLLCAKHVIARLRSIWKQGESHAPQGFSIVESLETIRELMVIKLENYYHANQNPVTKAAYIDVLTEVERTERDAADGKRVAVRTRFRRQMLDFEKELRYTLKAGTHNPAMPVLRKSLARAFAMELSQTVDQLEIHADQTIPLIQSLVATDADACRSIFETLLEDDTDKTESYSSASRVLLQAASQILIADVDVKLKCEVQKWLLSVADSDAPSDVGSKVSLDGVALPALLLDGNANQQLADQSLQLEAVAFEHRLASPACEPQTRLLALATWVEACTQAVQGSGLYSREAAALALSRLRETWSHMRELLPTAFGKLCLAVYDLLNDDDEDIRILASRIALRIVKSDGRQDVVVPLEPLESSQRLLRFMVDKPSHDIDFATEAFERAFGIPQSHSISFTDRLADATTTTTNTELFAEEKQNLYIDEAREVKVWFQVLLQLPASSMPRPLVKLLGKWIEEGLNGLVAKLKSEADGPLGWTTFPELFVLGLQLIYGSELMLSLVERGVQIPLRPSVLREKLVQCASVARRRNVNELWIREMERVVRVALLAQLQRRNVVMGSISSTIGK